MRRGSACVATATLLLLACRTGDKDTYVVLHSDVNCDVPRVFQLRVTISSGGMTDQKLVPDAPGPEMSFPSSLTLILPGSRSGDVDLVVEAVDANHQIVGRGMVGGTLVPEGRIDLAVLITTAVATGSNIAIGAPPATFDGGPSSSDGGAPVKADAGGGSSAGFAQVAAGSVSTCAVRLDGSLWCWGNNQYGELRMTGASARLTPAQVSPMGWSLVSAGQTHACGIRADATLSCWGNNASGQLGSGAAGSDNQQVDLPQGPWLGVSAGVYQTCAIKTDGGLWCWGDNTNGQLGTGNTLATAVPTQLSGAGYSQVSARFMHTCALKQDGTMWCWGMNSNLQLARDSPAFLYAPAQVQDSDWQQVTTGLYHTCGLKWNGSLWCWGGNMSGQVGNAALPAQSTSQTSTPLQVSGTWASLSAGATHTCGIMVDGSLWCWGDNSLGQLGIGSKVSQQVPAAVTVPGLTWSQVSAGLVHTCAVATDHSVWCWGKGSDGELGLGSTEDRSAPGQVNH
jgi:alpha-tubulin suppressor-like RCC1 family protein